MNMGINVRAFNNHKCVCCKEMETVLLRVGAYNMCEECFKREFNRGLVIDESYNDKPFLDKYYEILHSKYMVD